MVCGVSDQHPQEEKDREESRVTEGARRTTGVAREAAEFNGVGADSEVADKATRRQFSAKYKRRIVREADRCTKPGELGALLRREGLFSSALSTWRRQREAGELEGLRPAKRGRKGKPPDARDKRIAELERKNRRLEAKLTQAETVIVIQKKWLRCWGFP